MRILVATTTRADWGLLVPVLDALHEASEFDVRIVVTGQHLTGSNETLGMIAQDGYSPDYKIDMELGDDDSPGSLSRSIGRLFGGIGVVIESANPDLLMLLGDRYETLALAQAAVLARVPVAHLCGGDVTEGAIDDSFRHAITKLSAIHFSTNAESAARIVQMGEQPANVHTVGSTGVDRLLSVKAMERGAFFEFVGLVPRKHNFVVTFHPPTLSSNPAEQARCMLLALDGFPECGIVITGSNADPGGREIDELMRTYAGERDYAVYFASLGSEGYVSALTHCDAVIGNSSSGVMEAPSLRIPTVNIGDRQTRRPKASSVIDCAPQSEAVRVAIEAALAMDLSEVENPFGEGDSAHRIVDVLRKLRYPKSLTRKSFRDQGNVFDT